MEMNFDHKDYVHGKLSKTDLDPDPFRQFESWINLAIASNLIEPLALALATADRSGNVSIRMVLMRAFDERGIVFYTNYNSPKANHIAVNPQAGLLFYWAELERQVRIIGKIEQLSAEESDQYFKNRPYENQISSWASPQSQIIPSREFLEKSMEKYSSDFGKYVPRPDFWGGYLAIPQSFEFWQGRKSRLHDRFLYTRTSNNIWQINRLAP